jgi:hypothetical protein
VVRKRQVDVVLVWRYDGLTRSTQALISAMKEYHNLGGDFIPYRENTDMTPWGRDDLQRQSATGTV